MSPKGSKSKNPKKKRISKSPKKNELEESSSDSKAENNEQMISATFNNKQSEIRERRPKIVNYSYDRIKSRRPIRGSTHVEQAPIHDSTDEEQDSDAVEGEYKDTTEDSEKNNCIEGTTKNGLHGSIYTYIIIYSVVFGLIASFCYFCIILAVIPHEKPTKNLIECMRPIQEKFNNQHKDFWRSIESNIKYTINSEVPTSYIFLYENNAEETTKNLLEEVSKCVVPLLNDENSQAVNFTKEILESDLAEQDDYGSVHTHIEKKLKDNGLLIVENLNQVPEKFAMVFHTFCDEITPVVKKSAFFFTMRVKKDENLENVLRKEWNNLEEDKFVPLFARISGMPLRVNP